MFADVEHGGSQRFVQELSRRLGRQAPLGGQFRRGFRLTWEDACCGELADGSDVVRPWHGGIADIGTPHAHWLDWTLTGDMVIAIVALFAVVYATVHQGVADFMAGGRSVCGAVFDL